MSQKRLDLFHNSALKFIALDQIGSQRVQPSYLRKKQQFKLPSLQVSRIMIGNQGNTTESSYLNNQFGRRRILATPTLSLSILGTESQVESELKRKIKQKCLLKNANRMQILHKSK